MNHSELFAQIEQLVPTLNGWAIPPKCCEFAAIIVALRPQVTVELGTWAGRGAFSMALAHRFVERGKVWAVDPWSAKASVEGQDGENKKWWSDQHRHDLVYAEFLQTLEDLKLKPWMNVQRTTSDKAEMPNAIGLLVVDGNHGPQAVADVKRWGPQVARGGFVYLDDLNWSGGAVTEAGKLLLKTGFVPLYQRDQGMFYQKVSSGKKAP